MPDAKDNTKMTGDTHLPDTESEFDVEEANPQNAGENRKAGVLKDRDAPAGDSYDKTRRSGEQ
jgi:hypothetical protein